MNELLNENQDVMNTYRSGGISTRPMFSRLGLSTMKLAFMACVYRFGVAVTDTCRQKANRELRQRLPFYGLASGEGKLARNA